MALFWPAVRAAAPWSDSTEHRAGHFKFTPLNTLTDSDGTDTEGHTESWTWSITGLEIITELEQIKYFQHLLIDASSQERAIFYKSSISQIESCFATSVKIAACTQGMMSSVIWRGKRLQKLYLRVCVCGRSSLEKTPLCLPRDWTVPARSMLKGLGLD